MNVEAEVTINASKERIWEVISDIGEADKIIEGINKVEVLESQTAVSWVSSGEKPAP